MTLTIDLTSDEAANLRGRATAHGLDTVEFARRPLTRSLLEDMPPINLFNPNAMPDEIARNNAAAIALLDNWEDEDSIEGTEEAAALGQEWEDFKAAISREHSSDRVIYP